MPTLTTDEPAATAADDHLGRTNFATNLAAMILGASPGSSFRLGVFGEWGEGKTSVLRMMDERLGAEGQVTVWLSPWATRSPEDLLFRLLRNIATKLDIDLSPVDQANTRSEKVDSLRKKGEAADARVPL